LWYNTAPSDGCKSTFFTTATAILKPIPAKPPLYQKGFNFLGHTVRKYGDKLLITPAKSSIKALHQKIRLCIQSALGLSQEALLLKLNPIIRGWANYYRHGASKRTFDRLDHHVFWQLWRWAKRRHPNKSAAWKQRKYFSAAGHAIPTREIAKRTASASCEGSPIVWFGIGAARRASAAATHIFAPIAIITVRQVRPDPH
jgi:hypothetical protein